ncbi:MAG: response regulator [Flavobacteriales bacterium]|nr:response regulator [Flavobacteriales bacterium]MBP7157042.1 response regulator [Flavobacteriales bacterium]
MDLQIDKSLPVHTALLVDDEEEICLLLCNMLRRMGIVCDVAHSLQEGRKAIGSGEYDAVFLDVNLPDGLGYEMIPDIKEVLPNARLIAISAMDNERPRALEAGADIFVPKPFNRDTMFASIRKLGFIS